MKKLRIMFSSNAPFTTSGYGQQIKQILPRVVKEGYPTACVCFFGLQGGKIELDGVTMYPKMMGAWGDDAVRDHQITFNADVVITLQDIWPMDPEHLKHFKNWIPICVDGNTLVTLSDGSQKRISDIVELKLKVKVLGFDGENVVEANIKDWQKIPDKMDVYSLKTEKGELLITGNNEVFVNGEWIRADSIKVGDMVYYYNNGSYNEEAEAKEVGMGLYSGNNRRRGNNNNSESIKGKVEDREQKALNTSNAPRSKHGQRLNRLVSHENWNEDKRKEKEHGKQIQSFDGKIIQGDKDSLYNYDKRIQRVTDTRGDTSIPDSKKRESRDSKEVYRDENKEPETKIQRPVHEGTNRLMGESKDIKSEIVLAIEKVKAPKRTVYDISTETGNFFANQILIHNCPIDHEPVPPAIKERLNLAYRIITYAPFGERELRRNGMHSTYIPHTVDTEVFKKRNKKKLRNKVGIPEDMFLFGMVAANKDNPPRKSFQQVLDAFARFHKKHPNSGMYFHTFLRQDGGFPIDEYAKVLGIDKAIYSPSPYELSMLVDTNDMPDVYGIMDTFVLPSMNEGFGVPVIEAQACEVPVITSNFTATKDLVIDGKTGWLTEVAYKRYTPLLSYVGVPSVDSIYDKMELAYKADLKKMGKAGRKYIVDNFEMDVVWETRWKPFLRQLEKELYVDKEDKSK